MQLSLIKSEDAFESIGSIEPAFVKLFVVANVCVGLRSRIVDEAQVWVNCEYFEILKRVD